MTLTKEQKEEIDRFAERARQLQRIAADELHRLLDQDRQANRSRREHRHRLTLMAIGVAGFVVPYLFQATGATSSLNALKVAAAFCALAVAIALFAELGESELNTRYEAALGEDLMASASEQLFREVREVQKEAYEQSYTASDVATARLIAVRRQRAQLVNLEQVLFTGLFLGSLLLLTLSLLQR